MITDTMFTAADALQRLKDGNMRFLNGAARFPVIRTDVLAALEREQYPFATIIGCSDSRVPSELLFGLKPVVRKTETRDSGNEHV